MIFGVKCPLAALHRAAQVVRTVLITVPQRGYCRRGKRGTCWPDRCMPLAWIGAGRIKKWRAKRADRAYDGKRRPAEGA